MRYFKKLVPLLSQQLLDNMKCYLYPMCMYNMTFHISAGTSMTPLWAAAIVSHLYNIYSTDPSLLMPHPRFLNYCSFTVRFNIWTCTFPFLAAFWSWSFSRLVSCIYSFDEFDNQLCAWDVDWNGVTFREELRELDIVKHYMFPSVHVLGFVCFLQ